MTRVQTLSFLTACLPAMALAGTQTLSIYSPSNGRTVDFVVYTPPNYNASTQHYPVVFDLHGIGGAPTNRANLQIVPYLDAAITQGNAMPAIWVFANGQTDSFYGDAYDGHKQVYSHTILEVLPYVDANYRTVPHRRFRAIEGFSMGGFGAMMYAAKRTDLFSAVVGYSGAYQSWAGLLPAVKSAMYDGVQANFTPFSVYDQYQLNAAAVADSLKIRMLVGGSDPIQGSNQNLNNYLNALLGPLGMPSIPLTVVPNIDHDGKKMFETGIGLTFLNDHFLSTTPGDADLDDDVDFNDLLVLARHYGKSSNQSWLEGDFDWNGSVDFSDLLNLAKHYQGGPSVFASAGPTPVDSPTVDAWADWALAQSLVPEPSVACVVLSLLVLRRR